jgi:hypothetical protein
MEGTIDMNVPGTITPEQVDELNAIRDALFYLYLDLIDRRAEMDEHVKAERVIAAYNRTSLLYAAITHRPVATIDLPDRTVVQQEQTWTNSTGTYCRLCCADINTGHYPHCMFRQ